MHFRSGGLEKTHTRTRMKATQIGGQEAPHRRGVITCKNSDPHARRGRLKKLSDTMAGMPILYFATPPGRERDCKKSYIFKCFFNGFQKFENFDAFFCTPQAFWASHFLKLQNWRSPNVTLIVVSWTATLAAWEVLKKSEFAFLRPQDDFFFVLRA